MQLQTKQGYEYAGKTEFMPNLLERPSRYDKSFYSKLGDLYLQMTEKQ